MIIQQVKVGEPIKIGKKFYSIDCSDLYQMAGNEDGLFLQEIDEDDN